MKNISTLETFSSQSLEFLTLAGKQKKEDWLSRNDAEYQRLIRSPLLALAESVSYELTSEARGYHFPVRGIGRIKKPANKVEQGGAHFKDWVSFIATRPSKNRFEKNPLLFFGLLPNEPQWNGVVVAGGLYMTSSLQARRVRQAIADDSGPFRELFRDGAFKRHFKHEFDSRMKAQRCPRGFDAAHPEIEWIKLKAFFVCKKLTMKEFSSPNLAQNLAGDFRQLLRLNELLQKAVNGSW